MSSRVRRLPVVDEYVEDGRSAVLVEGRAFSLSEVATLVLHHLDEEWSDVRELADTLEREVGAPEEGDLREALEALLGDLSAHGLVETV